MDWNGANCSISDGRTVVVRNRKDWDRLWRDAFGRPSPEASFEGRFAVAVFLGSRSTGGYGVEFRAPFREEGRTVVPYRVASPGKGSFAIQAFTQPYAIRMFDGDPGEVAVREEG